MINQQPSLRFDHREIAVIFSLFVFVSLLMFTVGILVGKGLAQARYEGNLAVDRRLDTLGDQIGSLASPDAKSGGNSVTLGEKIIPERPEMKPADSKPMDISNAQDTTESIPEQQPLVLIPQKAKHASSGGLLGSGQSEADKLLSNPKLKGLIEEDPAAKRRSLASKGGVPGSLSNGKFTVQVGSYPAQKDATERVETLKKLGFSYAYFSAKELGENREVWYRVWLGYFPDYETADDAGKYLANRGEVRHYLVRKADTSG